MTFPFPAYRPSRLCLGLLALLLAPGAALAQAAPAAIDPARIDPQVTLRLIDLLVAKGVMTRAQADDLIREASTVAATAPAASGKLPYQTQPGAVVVPYVPETVRQQIKDELRAEVTAQAKSEGWATPGALPEWTQRLRLYGDLRVRGEGVFNADDNYAFFPDFGDINGGSGFDVVGTSNAPFVNTTRNRSRMRVRARLGVQAQIADWVQADLRLATGSDRSPVSTNQTLGGSGNLSKYSLWLDRAALQLSPTESLSLSFGRFANPFWSSELMFDNDLNFDGVAARYDLAGRDEDADFAPWLSAGLFPVYNTDFDFGSTSTAKTRSRDKWMYGAQLGARWRFADDAALTVGLGYFQYDQFEGERSSPCLAPTSADSCDSDGSRPQFQQFGNTLFAIRDIVADAANPNGPQLQYYGYASKFGVADLHAQLQLDQFDPVKVLIEADVLKNTRYNVARIRSLGPVNNLGDQGVFDGGDLGYYVNVTVGQPKPTQPGDWNVSLGYKYLESDAVPDGFTDSDFHLGGTNARGLIVGGSYGLARNTWLGLRWLSANEISGAPFAVDVLQLDLGTEF